MKDQLKKTLSYALRQVPIKTEDIIKIKKPSWQTNSAIWKSSMNIHKTHYRQNMNTTHLEIQWISSGAKNFKHSTTKETTEIMHKSIIIKIDKTIKHLNQEHLYLTTIDNIDPKLNWCNKNPCDRNGTQLQCYMFV